MIAVRFWRRLLVHRSITVAGSSHVELIRFAVGALNRYKHAIFLHRSVSAGLLVQYGICAILCDIEHVSKGSFSMINTVKVAVSAIALAALVAAPAVAKSRTQQQAAPQTYSNQGVHAEGHNLGTDPDPRVRSEIMRDGNAAYE
jgi:hypothetical protein